MKGSASFLLFAGGLTLPSGIVRFTASFFSLLLTSSPGEAIGLEFSFLAAGGGSPCSPLRDNPAFLGPRGAPAGGEGSRFLFTSVVDERFRAFAAGGGVVAEARTAGTCLS